MLFFFFLVVFLNLMFVIGVFVVFLIIFVIYIYFKFEDEEILNFMESILIFVVKMVCWRYYICCCSIDNFSVGVVFL